MDMMHLSVLKIVKSQHQRILGKIALVKGASTSVASGKPIYYTDILAL